MRPVALLCDKNLSEAVPAELRDPFTDSLHVRRALGAGARASRPHRRAAQRNLGLTP